LFLSGCVGFGIGDLSMFQAYPRIGARRTIVLIQCLAAPFGALIEWLWLHHTPTGAQAFYGVVILLGVAIALIPAKKDAQPTQGLVTGTLFGILAGFCQGSSAVISRKAYEVARDAGHPFHSVTDGINAAYQRILGGILVSVLFFGYLRLAHKPDPDDKRDWRRGLKWVAANAMVGPAFGVSCYQWALMTEKTSIVLPIVATTPLAVMPSLTTSKVIASPGAPGLVACWPSLESSVSVIRGIRTSAVGTPSSRSASRNLKTGRAGARRS